MAKFMLIAVVGKIHKATFEGLVHLKLANKKIYYIFGDKKTNLWSEEFVFMVPPEAGANPPTRPTRVALLAGL